MSLVGSAAFILTSLGLLVAMAGLAYAFLARRFDLAQAILKCVLIGLGGYFGALLAVSLTSSEKVLGLNEEKKFCGADCDLAFSVINVTQTKTLGHQPDQKTAGGIFYLVAVKVRSDAARVTMTPDSPAAVVIDDQGREYRPSPEGQQALASVQGEDGPFARALAPGSSYTKDLVFDLPSGVKNPCLFISEGGWMTRLIIGDENSFFHRKTKIRLAPPGDRGAPGL